MRRGDSVGTSPRESVPVEVGDRDGAAKDGMNVALDSTVGEMESREVTGASDTDGASCVGPVDGDGVGNVDIDAAIGDDGCVETESVLIVGAGVNARVGRAEGISGDDNGSDRIVGAAVGKAVGPWMSLDAGNGDDVGNVDIGVGVADDDRKDVGSIDGDGDDDGDDVGV